MNKLKVLLTILMGTLIAFSAQRAYYVKTGELSSIYSDIIFTRLAVESQEYTRQIEYGVKNGKSLENFYNISSVLSGVRRCCSYTNGVYIFSSDRRQLYSLNDGGSPVTRFSVGDFSGGSVYSVYDGAMSCPCRFSAAETRSAVTWFWISAATQWKTRSPISRRNTGSSPPRWGSCAG